MKKYITLIIVSIFTISSCEKDDICVESNTPSLIIRFYDNDLQTEIKQVIGLTVWADGKDWGDYEEFRKWVMSGSTDPPPKELEKAVDICRSGLAWDRQELERTSE